MASVIPIASKGADDPLGSYKNPFKAADAITLSETLRIICHDFRWNLRAARVEYREAVVPGDPTPWECATDRVTAKVRDTIERQFWLERKTGPVPLRYGRERWHDALNALLFHLEVDPFEEWLDALAQWDGENRLDPLLVNLFEADVDNLLCAWAGRYLFLGAVQRTFDPGCKLDEIPVFIGAQGIGKSALLREMLPPEMPELHGDGLRWDARPQEQVDAVLGRVVVESSEMVGRSRAEIEIIKAFISRRDDGNVRRPYARTAEPLLRRYIIAATTNNSNDLPNDPSGNRRFVPILLSRGCNIESVMDSERDQLWAEAMYCYRKGEHANLPRDLMKAQAKQVEDHRDRDDLVEDAIANLNRESLYQMDQIKSSMPDSLKDASPQRIVKALQNAGWRGTRTYRNGSRTRVWQFHGTHGTGRDTLS